MEDPDSTEAMPRTPGRAVGRSGRRQAPKWPRTMSSGRRDYAQGDHQPLAATE